MISIVGFCLLAVILVLGIGFVATLLELILRAVLAVVMALTFVTVVGAVYSHGAEISVFPGVTMFSLALIPSFFLIGRMRAVQAARKMRGVQANAANSPVSPAQACSRSSPTKCESPKVSFADKALAQAWDDAMVLAPHAGLESARDACAQFMAVSAKAGKCDISMIDYAVFIRRNVPELVRETAELIALVSKPEGERVIAGLTADLVAVSEGARLRIDAISQGFRDQLAVRRQHIATQLGNGSVPFQSD